jgi:hypothetical protein
VELRITKVELSLTCQDLLVDQPSAVSAVDGRIGTRDKTFYAGGKEECEDRKWRILVSRGKVQ